MRNFSLAALACGAALAAGPATRAQDADKPAQNIAAINTAYERDLRQIEARRLERLAELAAGQPKAQADATYEVYFQHVIAGGLYEEAEPLAERLLQKKEAPAAVLAMAMLSNIVAEADRGAYAESIQSLKAAIEASEKARDGGGGASAIDLPVSTRLSIIEAYYQRLMRADQIETARKGMQLILDATKSEPIRDLCNRRLRHLSMIGKQAPPIVGVDFDGKPVSLADSRGKVVLVVFWASWCVPCAAEVHWFDQVYQKYRDKGFEVLGVNLDTASDGGQDFQTVLPNIRRFLIDHNVRWPNVINGPGERDHAAAYGVTEIPTNFLIDRDGKIIHLDLSQSNLEEDVAKAVAP